MTEIVSDIAISATFCPTGLAKPRFNCTVRSNGARSVLGLDGEFDMAASDEVEGQLASLRRSNPAGIVVDLSEVTFVDSTGLHILLRLQAASREEGFELSIVRGGEQIAKVFEITGLDAVLPFVDAVPDQSA
jgi:anti-anti-sigma factor